MRAIRAAMKEFEYSDVEPDDWGRSEKLSFIGVAESKMSFEEFCGFDDSAKEIIPEVFIPAMQAYDYERETASIAIMFTDKNIEIIKTYTYGNEPSEESENRADDEQARFRDAS